MERKEKEFLDNEAVHNFFGLSYASYLVLPRVALQSMPPKWQRQFVKMVEEVREHLIEFDEMEPDAYSVHSKNLSGKYVKSKWPQYRHNKLTYR